ncbi:hypothetical protein IWX49DRAFT_156109 [Phyllosticta citricarpa]|uniref:Transmembrane protein n=1 Tax=Phyllosticta citricarpa TaxID=55181 RepID=A0ABR1MJA0_9PEZI
MTTHVAGQWAPSHHHEKAKSLAKKETEKRRTYLFPITSTLLLSARLILRQNDAFLAQQKSSKNERERERKKMTSRPWGHCRRRRRYCLFTPQLFAIKQTKERKKSRLSDSSHRIPSIWFDSVRFPAPFPILSYPTQSYPVSGFPFGVVCVLFWVLEPFFGLLMRAFFLTSFLIRRASVSWMDGWLVEIVAAAHWRRWRRRRRKMAKTDWMIDWLRMTMAASDDVDMNGCVSGWTRDRRLKRAWFVFLLWRESGLVVSFFFFSFSPFFLFFLSLLLFLFLHARKKKKGGKRNKKWRLLDRTGQDRTGQDSKTKYPSSLCFFVSFSSLVSPLSPIYLSMLSVR